MNLRRISVVLVGVAACVAITFPATAGLNTGPGSDQVWMYHSEWKNFSFDPLTRQDYLPNATNRVFSVLNLTTRNIHFLEWDFGAPGSVCITVPPDTVVNDVTRYSDGG